MIDAHVHIWRLARHDCVWPTPDEGVLYRDFTLEELIAALDEAGIDRAILVQSQESARDTAWLIETGMTTDCISGVIGWADLCDRAAVAALSDQPLLKGVRPMVQARAADWYDDPALDAGLETMAEHGLVLDALIRPVHLPALDRLAARHPDLVVVIDHAAKPTGGPAGFHAWKTAIAPLADRPNVHVKLSGLTTEIARDAVGPVVEAVIALFGPERLLWGSDWPVVTVSDGYRGWYELATTLIPAAHHGAVFGGNAATVYGLQEGGHA